MQSESYAGPVRTEISLIRPKHRRNVFSSFGDETCRRTDLHIMRSLCTLSAKQNVGPNEQFIFSEADSTWQSFRWRLPRTPSTPENQILKNGVEIWDSRLGEYFDVTSCRLLDRHQLFGGTCCLYSEDGGSRFLRNVGAFLSDCTTSCLRRPLS
jgi:hypothetical protein